MANTSNKLPTMYDLDMWTLIGMNPKTGLPLKADAGCGCGLKEAIKAEIMKNDKQIALNRYKWSNLPAGLTAEIIETVLYTRGQGMMFYNENDGKFYFLPFVMQAPSNSTGLDCYGRLVAVSPLPLVGGAVDTNGNPQPWIPGYIKTPIYEPKLDLITPEDYTNNCVLLYDYAHGVNEPNIVPMATLQQGIIDVMAECIPYAQTALINATGINGMRVNSEDEVGEVNNANAQVKNAALQGRRFIPIRSKNGLDFQELAPGQVAKVEEFLMAMQSFDNFRLGQYGIGEGAVFTKKAHMLESEQNMNQGNVGLIYDTGLLLRQYMCLLAYSNWGLTMWCEANETIAGIDKNMDGEISEEYDGQESLDHPHNQPEAGGNEE